MEGQHFLCARVGEGQLGRIVFVGVNGYKCTATTIIMLDFRYAVKSVIVLSAFVACEASMDEKSGCDFPSGQRIRFFV